jgi:Fe-S cluster assembly protein SufD
VVGNSQSNLFVRGVFDDSSKFLYEGLIQIDKKAQKSNAYQKNQNIILSNKVYVDSRPFLEIQANDVRCTHGSTTGRLNTEELFYVQSRGFDIIEAKKLLIQGFKAEVFNQMLNLGVELKHLPYEAQSFS